MSRLARSLLRITATVSVTHFTSSTVSIPITGPSVGGRKSAARPADSKWMVLRLRKMSLSMSQRARCARGVHGGAWHWRARLEEGEDGGGGTAGRLNKLSAALRIEATRGRGQLQRTVHPATIRRRANGARAKHIGMPALFSLFRELRVASRACPFKSHPRKYSDVCSVPNSGQSKYSTARPAATTCDTTRHLRGILMLSKTSPAFGQGTDHELALLDPRGRSAQPGDPAGRPERLCKGCERGGVYEQHATGGGRGRGWRITHGSIHQILVGGGQSHRAARPGIVGHGSARAEKGQRRGGAGDDGMARDAAGYAALLAAPESATAARADAIFPSTGTGTSGGYMDNI
ncbi:hypothetical protein B0H14DRAFT_2643036 [Mycena olivaceomarginata]|nr:hypothetical protein B0H14DRAFT_2643036 [Mycena olivaceomarginata]